MDLLLIMPGGGTVPPRCMPIADRALSGVGYGERRVLTKSLRERGVIVVRPLNVPHEFTLNCAPSGTFSVPIALHLSDHRRPGRFS